MGPLICDRYSHGHIPFCDGYATKERLGDSKVDTHSGKFSFEVKEGVLVNSNYVAHMVKQLPEAF